MVAAFITLVIILLTIVITLVNTYNYARAARWVINSLRPPWNPESRNNKQCFVQCSGGTEILAGPKFFC